MLAVILCSLLAGVCLTLLIELLLCYKWSTKLPINPPSWKPQTEPYVLPAQLQTAMHEMTDTDKKETCQGLNLLLQFLFQELKDTRKIRRWVMRRMQKEFAEMLQQSTTGKLLEQITVRDFNLGSTFPIIRSATTSNVVVNDDNVIETVTLLLDLTYNGRFQLAIDVDMVFGRSAYLSVMMTKLQGIARLQFTRQPFTHWSFAFTHDPLLEFEVESQLEGRPIPQLASIIVNQIRKAVRKKHTLPAYKLRYQPFFTMPSAPSTPADHSNIYFEGYKLSVGRLRVNVINCSRLMQLTIADASVYCTLSVDRLAWAQLMIYQLKQYKTYELEIIKTKDTGPLVGMNYTEEYVTDRGETVVVVAHVFPGSPAETARISKGDILMAINGIKVLNSKQVTRLMKQSADRVLVRVERSSASKTGSVPGPQVVQDHNDDDDDEPSVGSTVPTTGDQDDDDNYVDSTSSTEHLENKALLTDASDRSKPVGPLSTNPKTFSSKQTTNKSEEAALLHSGKPASSAGLSEHAVSVPSSGGSQLTVPSGTSVAKPATGDSQQLAASSGSTSLLSSGNSSSLLVPKSDAGSTTATSKQPNNSTSSTSRVAAMPPLAKKLLNTSSALFQRKKVPRPDPKSIAFSSANSTVTVADVSGADSGSVTSSSTSSVDSSGLSATSASTNVVPPAGICRGNVLGDGNTEKTADKSNTLMPAPNDKNVLRDKGAAIDDSELVSLRVDATRVRRKSAEDALSSAAEVDRCENTSTGAKFQQQNLETISSGSLDHLISDKAGSHRTSSPTRVPSTSTVGSKKTHLVRSCPSPAFNEKFDFDVTEEHRFLNICVWCRLPPKLDKQQRILKPEKEVMIGHTSVDLADIALNCVTTLQGDFTETFTLTPSEFKVDIGKPQFANLTTHPGFSELFCYGDVTLRFQYTWPSMTDREQKKIIKQHEVIEQLQSTTESHAVYNKQANLCEKSHVPCPSSSVEKLYANGKQHTFMVAQFSTTIYCDFCAKKIWLKSAFRCSECSKVCHKKCMEKCQLQTVCIPNRSKVNKPAVPVKTDFNPAGKQVPTEFSATKTDVNAAAEEHERKRHTSAPDESHSDTESAISASKISSTVLPRPRSSNSLQEVATRSRTPSIEELMSTATTSAALVRGDEFKLVQLFERAKKVQNTDEMVVTKAKRMGKELFAELDPEARKLKLDGIISRLQSEIDTESEHRSDLARQARTATDRKMRLSIEAKVEKSDEKLDSMTVLMLHYCAGLQHCMDQEENERQRQLELELAKNGSDSKMSEIDSESQQALTDVESIDYDVSRQDHEFVTFAVGESESESASCDTHSIDRSSEYGCCASKTSLELNVAPEVELQSVVDYGVRSCGQPSELDNSELCQPPLVSNLSDTQVTATISTEKPTDDVLSEAESHCIDNSAP